MKSFKKFVPKSFCSIFALLFLNLFHNNFCEKKDLVAQLVEQYTFNVWVLGSSPSQITSLCNAEVFLCHTLIFYTQQRLISIMWEPVLI